MSSDLNNIDMATLVSQYVPVERMGSRHRAKCPFHDDHDPSFVIYPHSAFCFGCNQYYGPASFIATFENIPYTEALKKLELQYDIQLVQLPKQQREYKYPIPQEIIEHWHTQVRRDYMYSRLLEDETINFYMLGYDGTHDIIPVWEGEPGKSEVYAIKRRRINGSGPKYVSLKGRGQPRLFNKWSLKDANTAIVFIGEFDAILGYQDGLPAISSTSGQNSWETNWSPYMQHLTHIYICPDYGESVAGYNIASTFLGRSSVHTFPREAKDYTEYRQAGYTVEDFTTNILGVDYNELRQD